MLVDRCCQTVAGLSEVASVSNQKPLDARTGPTRLIISNNGSTVVFWYLQDQCRHYAYLFRTSNDNGMCRSVRCCGQNQHPKAAHHMLTADLQGIKAIQGTTQRKQAKFAACTSCGAAVGTSSAARTGVVEPCRDLQATSTRCTNVGLHSIIAQSSEYRSRMA